MFCNGQRRGGALGIDSSVASLQGLTHAESFSGSLMFPCERDRLKNAVLLAALQTSWTL